METQVRKEQGKYHRLSVTTLEDYFNYFLPNPCYQFEKFVEKLKVKTEPTLKMIRGIAFNAILQEPHKFESDSLFYYYKDENFEYAIPIYAIQPGISFLNKVRNIVRWEYKKEHIIETFTNDKVKIISQCDGYTDNGLIEIKTTEKYNYNNYAKSLQWRFYLDIFEAQQIEYMVLELEETTRKKAIEELNKLYQNIKNNQIVNYKEMLLYIDLLENFLNKTTKEQNLLILKNIHNFTFFNTNKAIKQENEQKVNQFWKFLVDNNLTQYLKFQE